MRFLKKILRTHIVIPSLSKQRSWTIGRQIPPSQANYASETQSFEIFLEKKRKTLGVNAKMVSKKGPVDFVVMKNSATINPKKHICNGQVPHEKAQSIHRLRSKTSPNDYH